MFKQSLWASLIDFKPISAYPKLPCPFCNTVKLAIDTESLYFRNSSPNKGDVIANRANKAIHKNISSVYKENKFFGVLYGIAVLGDAAKSYLKKFTVFFACEECGGNVAATGTAKSSKDSFDDATQSSIKVEYFTPPVPMFHISEHTPDSVTQEVLQAFNHFHCDLAGSGSKIRRALEKICKELNFSGKQLHHRLEAMAQVYPTQAHWLQSLKLLGNEASHDDGVDEVDLLKAFQILEAVLDLFRQREIEKAINEMLPELKSKFQRLSMSETLKTSTDAHKAKQGPDA